MKESITTAFHLVRLSGDKTLNYRSNCRYRLAEAAHEVKGTARRMGPA